MVFSSKLKALLPAKTGDARFCGEFPALSLVQTTDAA
jgi:hypothetical protein